MCLTVQQYKYNIYKAAFSPGSIQQIMLYYKLLVAHTSTVFYAIEQSTNDRRQVSAFYIFCVEFSLV
jgi:hypothetical protein